MCNLDPVVEPVNSVLMVCVQKFQVVVVGLHTRGHFREEMLIFASSWGWAWLQGFRTCRRRCMPVWSVISASVVICRYMRHALICLSCDCVRPTSEAEEWLILVPSGYSNNPVPAYFSTSHLLILIQTRINISRLWTIISQVVDYYKPGFGLL